MKIKQKGADIHQIVYGPWRWLLLLAFLAIALVFVILMTRPSEPDGLIHQAGSCVCLILVIICAARIYERSRFIFDTRRRIMIWDRKSLGFSQKGRVPFDRIESIYIEEKEEPELDDWVGGRIIVQTSQGSIPMTENHFKHGTFPLRDITDLLNGLVGLSIPVSASTSGVGEPSAPTTQGEAS